MERLKAPDGQYYTQAADVPAKERVFANVVYLGAPDSPDNWRLAEASERAAVEAQLEAEAAAERAKAEKEG